MECTARTTHYSVSPHFRGVRREGFHCIGCTHGISHTGFSPGHLGVRAPYALHYEPYALILALRFIYVALRVVRVWYVRKKSAYACVIHSTIYV